ncbi:hypothetical protein OEA41_006186 [Lepraria neglecta]|uniref:Inhibitor I9 domain-containing protein n=1 Tax=Lepraria neglecta TaxID=209136 RepID=A0AAD9Z7E3_9LECA|nr:hypothetical protein OEA41_006186 [Lepraria neglecta]
MYNITLKQGAAPEQIDKAKESARQQGGTIKHEFTLIKGFTYCSFLYMVPDILLTQPSVEFPNDTVHTLQTDNHIHVEQDGEARAY